MFVCMDECIHVCLHKTVCMYKAIYTAHVGDLSVFAAQYCLHTLVAQQR